jgi:hypothetical protein
MPATGNFILDKGYDAAAAITKFRAVKFTAEETVGPVTAITDVVAGVEQFGVSATEITKGKGASIRQSGATEMEAAGLCTVGSLAAIVSDGRVQNATTGARVIGQFRQGAASAGNRCSVALDLPGFLAP